MIKFRLATISTIYSFLFVAYEQSHLVSPESEGDVASASIPHIQDGGTHARRDSPASFARKTGMHMMGTSFSAGESSSAESAQQRISELDTGNYSDIIRSNIPQHIASM